MARVISIREWSRFQHYKDRDPPWVKLYRDILTTEAWVLGTDTSRLVQIASILLAARYNNQIPLNFGLIQKVAHIDCDEASFMAAIEHLAAFQFIEIIEVNDPCKQPASAVLATCTTTSKPMLPREEQRREEKNSVRASPSDPPKLDAALYAEARQIFGQSIGGQINRAIRAKGKPWVVEMIETCRGKDPEAARAYLAAALQERSRGVVV